MAKIRVYTKQEYIDWLRDVLIPGVEASPLPPVRKADTIARMEQQIRDIQWCIDNDCPPPICAWKKSYAEHGFTTCPQNHRLCRKQYAIRPVAAPIGVNIP